MMPVILCPFTHTHTVPSFSQLSVLERIIHLLSPLTPGIISNVQKTDWHSTYMYPLHPSGCAKCCTSGLCWLSRIETINIHLLLVKTPKPTLANPPRVVVVLHISIISRWVAVRAKTSLNQDWRSGWKIWLAVHSTQLFLKLLSSLSKRTCYYCDLTWES